MLLTAFLLSLVAWWLATGVVLTLVHLTGAYKFNAFGAISAITVGAVVLLIQNVHASTIWDVTLGFFLGLLIWAWLETSYLMGFVTGPNKKPFLAHESEMQRFLGGIGTSLYHEISIIAAVVALGYVSNDVRNPIAYHTVLVLWLMRWSTKLNLFLGSSHFNVDWLPSHLAHTASYVRIGKTSPLAVLSIACCAAATFFLLAAAHESVELYRKYSLLLITGLAALGTIEHLFLTLPFGEEKLWRWFKRNAPN